MNRLLTFLFENPILLFVLAAWVVGAIGNSVRSAQKRQQQGEARRPAGARPPASAPPARRSAEDVAAEMRRILGMEDPRVEPPRPEVARPRPAAAPAAARRDVALPERPPALVLPTTQDRRLPSQVDPHVGERIQNRLSPKSGRVGQHERGQALGSLGGRVHEARAKKRAGVRLIDLVDLKRAFVMNEILGKPLALRPQDEQRS